MSYENSQDNFGDIFCIDILEHVFFFGFFVCYSLDFYVSHKLFIWANAVLVWVLFIQQLACEIQDVVEVRDKDFLFKSCISWVEMIVFLLLLSLMSTVFHRDPPNFVENESAFA